MGYGIALPCCLAVHRTVCTDSVLRSSIDLVCEFFFFFKLDLCLLWQITQDVTSLGSDKSIPIHARIIGAVYAHYWNTADDISDSAIVRSTECRTQIVVYILRRGLLYGVLERLFVS